MFEKRYYVGYYDGVGDGCDVVLQCLIVYWLDISQYVNGYDWVLQDDVGQFVGIDFVEIGVYFVEVVFGDVQYGQCVVVEE